MDIPDEYLYRPEALAESLYGTPDLFYIILLVNNIASSTNFNKKSIKVLDPGSNIINLIISTHMHQLNQQRANPYVVKDLTIKEVY
jgi:hypothetical protein